MCKPAGWGPALSLPACSFAPKKGENLASSFGRSIACVLICPKEEGEKDKPRFAVTASVSASKRMPVRPAPLDHCCHHPIPPQVEHKIDTLALDPSRSGGLVCVKRPQLMLFASMRESLSSRVMCRRRAGCTQSSGAEGARTPFLQGLPAMQIVGLLAVQLHTEQRGGRGARALSPGERALRREGRHTHNPPPHTHTHTHTCARTHNPPHTPPPPHTPTLTPTPTHRHTHTHTHTLTHTHTHIKTHTHTLAAWHPWDAAICWLAHAVMAPAHTLKGRGDEPRGVLVGWHTSDAALLTQRHLDKGKV